MHEESSNKTREPDGGKTHEKEKKKKETVATPPRRIALIPLTTRNPSNKVA